MRGNNSWIKYLGQKRECKIIHRMINYDSWGRVGDKLEGEESEFFDIIEDLVYFLPKLPQLKSVR